MSSHWLETVIADITQRTLEKPIKEFWIWITNDAEIKMGWTDEKKGNTVRSEIYFKTVQEAKDWADTYTGFWDSEIRSRIERILFANEY